MNRSNRWTQWINAHPGFQKTTVPKGEESRFRSACYRAGIPIKSKTSFDEKTVAFHRKKK